MISPYRPKAWFAACLVVAAIGVSAVADEIVLANGARLGGQIRSDRDAPRSLVTIVAPHGKIVVDRSDVSRIRSESPGDAEYRRRAPSVSDTVEAQFALAIWCRDNGIREGLRRHLERVLQLAPDHEEARMLLGYQNVDGEWMTRDDVLAARGLVRWQGEYRTRQEVALLEHQQRQEAAMLAWRKRLARLRSDLGSRDAATAQAAVDAFDTLDDPQATQELIALLSKERDPSVRRRLIRVLGRTATPAGLGALVQVAIGDPDGELRAEALDQLAADGRPGLAGPFVAALQSKDQRIVNNAGYALRRVGSSEVIEPLIDALVATRYRQVGNNSGGQTYSLSPGAGTTSFGGGGPRTEVRKEQNTSVLETLVQRTGVNFLFDESRWREWLAAQQVAAPIDLRRDF